MATALETAPETVPAHAEPVEKLMTRHRAHVVLGATRAAVDAWIVAQRLDARRVAGRVLVTVSSVERLRAERAALAAAVTA